MHCTTKNVLKLYNIIREGKNYITGVNNKENKENHFNNN